MSHRHSRLPATLALCVALTLSFAAVAQENASPDSDVVRPGHPDVSPETIRPFRAEYSQMGFPFRLDLRRVDGERSRFSAVMIMESPAGIAVDHAGFWADDLGFAYRKTSFGRWGPEYLDVSERNGEILMARMSLDPEGYDQRRLVRERPAAPMFEGTLMYWLLAALPLAQENGGFATATLGWTETGFEESITEFRVVGRETIRVDGASYDTVIVSASNDRFELRSYVAHRPPYLIRQVAIQDGQQQPVIELRSVRADDPGEPGSVPGGR